MISITVPFLWAVSYCEYPDEGSVLVWSFTRLHAEVVGCRYLDTDRASVTAHRMDLNSAIQRFRGSS